MLVQAVFILGSLLCTLAIGIDAALYLFQRQKVSHALLDTLRQQTRSHMQPQRFAHQFRAELEALGVSQPNGWPDSWHIEQLSPNDADFATFRDPQVEQQLPWPHAAINNHYQKRQHQYFGLLRNGQEKRDIFSANTLHIHIFYAFQPLNPVVRVLLKQARPFAQHPYTRQLLDKGQLPISINMRIPYASHPVAWPNDPALPYYRHTHSELALQPGPGTPVTQTPPPQSPPYNQDAGSNSWYLPWRPAPFSSSSKQETDAISPPAQYEQISHPPESCPNPLAPAPQSPAPQPLL